jgi:CHASE2 domain-containing sensor protein
MKNPFEIFILVGYIITGLLLIFYSATLTHIFNGKRFPTIITIVALLFISNLATLAVYTADDQITDKQGNPGFNVLWWDWFGAIAVFL